MPHDPRRKPLGLALPNLPSGAVADRWARAGALCDLAIESIAQCPRDAGPARQRAWEAAETAIGALEALIALPLAPGEQEAMARKEFAAVEKASLVYPGWREWGMSARAWSESARLLRPRESASLGLGRFARLAKGLARSGHLECETLRRDVGGKLLKIMKDGHLLWNHRGQTTPMSEAVRDRLLRLHGDWCHTAGALADSDWEIGVHAYGYGTWRDQFQSGDPSSPCMAWRDKLLSACEQGLERFGRLPFMPEGHGPILPHWMLLENYVAHSAQNGFSRPQWQWGVQFPLAGATAWDKKALAGQGWADPALLDDPLRGRGAAILTLVKREYGPGRELNELIQGQGRWVALLESRLMRASVARAPEALAPSAPKSRARSL